MRKTEELSFQTLIKVKAALQQGKAAFCITNRCVLYSTIIFFSEDCTPSVIFRI